MEGGVTAFDPFPAPSYRYAVSSKGSQLRNSIEDSKTKKNKWCTGYLDETKYLTGANRILLTSAADYVSVYHGAQEYMMGSPLGIDESGSDSDDAEDDDGRRMQREEEAQTMPEADPEKIRRRLTFLENSSNFGPTSGLMGQLGRPNMERIDILEARILDLEAEVVATKMAEQKNEELAYVTAKAEKPAEKSNDGEIQWFSVKGGLATLSYNQ